MTTPKKTPAPRNRSRSRTEIAEEFEGIKSEVAKAEAIDPKTAAATRARSAAVRASVQGVTVETAVQNTANLGLEVQRALAGVSEKLVQATQELADTNEAIRLANEELETIHKIDTAATAIDILIQDYEEKNKTLEETFKEKETLALREETERARKTQEAERNSAQQRQREIDEYTYKKNQERAFAEDAFKEKMRVQARDNEIRQQELARGWADREASLKAQEEETVKLRAEVASYPEKLSKETAAQVAIATNSLKRNLEMEFSLKSKDMETNARIQQAQLVELNKQLTSATEINARLQAQLDLANAKVESIATKAIEGSSKRDAFEAAMQLNQSKDNSTSQRGKA